MTLVRLLLFLPALLSLSAEAHLGGPESSVKADMRALGAQDKLILKKDYSIHVLSSAGNTVKEFVLPNGIVFGISWQGRLQPDLSVLLGQYLKEYEQAVSKQKFKKRGAKSVRTDNLVVERSGHPRDLRGVGYLPKLLPRGFSFEDQ